MSRQRSLYPSLNTTTFGIEYEFYVHENTILTKDETDANLIDEHGTIRNSTFSRAGIFVQDMLSQLGLHHPVEVTNTFEASSQASWNETSYKAWVIKTDPTLVPFDKSNCLPYIQMELVTPVLKNRSSLHQEVVRVGQALHDSPYVEFSELCGLHVHVGNKELGISLLTCKKLFSLLFVGGESILEGLFRKERRDNPNCRPIEYYAPAYVNPDGNYHLTGEVDMDCFNSCFYQYPLDIDERRRNALWEVWKANNIYEFCEVASAVPRLAITFHHLVGSEKPTIEFRKAEGNLKNNLNVEFLSAWPQVCIGLVAFAIDADMADFVRVLTDIRTALRARTSAEKLQLFLTSLSFDNSVIRTLVERANYLYPEQLREGVLISI